MWPLGIVLTLLSGLQAAICQQDLVQARRVAPTDPQRSNPKQLATARLTAALATVALAVCTAHDLYVALGFASGYGILSALFAPAAVALWATTHALRILAVPFSARSENHRFALGLLTTIGFGATFCSGGAIAVPLLLLGLPNALPTVLLTAPLLVMHRALRKRAGEVLAAARTSTEPGVHPQRAVAAARGSLALLAIAPVPFVCTSCGLLDPKGAAIALVPIGLGVAVFAPLLMMWSSDATPAGMHTSTKRFVQFLLLWLAFALSLYAEYSWR